MASSPSPGARPPAATVFRPPDLPNSLPAKPTIFLAGPTSSSTTPNWRARLIAALCSTPCDILDPQNPAWDSTWIEDSSDARWRSQVEWEMAARERAYVVAFFFEAGTDAPISLLELGLSLGRRQRVVVFTERGYSKRGNVKMVCERLGVAVVEEEEEVFVEEVKGAVAGLGLTSLTSHS